MCLPLSAIYAIPEEALEESKGDVGSQEARARDEDAVIEDSSLQESHEQVHIYTTVDSRTLGLTLYTCLYYIIIVVLKF